MLEDVSSWKKEHARIRNERNAEIQRATNVVEFTTFTVDGDQAISRYKTLPRQLHFTLALLNSAPLG